MTATAPERGAAATEIKTEASGKHKPALISPQEPPLTW
jgi:hypothetical protein